jgi:AcrR family transcriptional regulator
MATDSPAASDRPRSRGAEATRQRLMDAGCSAFAEKGLAGVNLRDDVLAPSGVSVGSFYHQFKDKTELLLAILGDHAETFRRRLSEIHTPEPESTARDIAERSYALMFDLADQDTAIMRIQMKERDSREPRVRAFLHADRKRWMDSLADDYRRIESSSGTPIGSDFDADLAARLIVGLCYAAMAEYTEAPIDARPAERARLLRGLVDFTMGGIGGLVRTR